MKTTTSFRYLLPLGFAAVAAPALAADTATAPLWSELSVAAKWGYDTNVFGTEAALADAPIANRTSAFWQTTVKAGLNVPPELAPGTKTTLAYQAVDTRFDRFSATESNTAHRIQGQSSLVRGAWKASADASLVYVDGSDDLPRYSTYSAYGIVLPRERREQLQTNLKADLRWTGAGYFARLNGAYINYDLMSEHHQPSGAYTGCVNYIDRSDIWGGVGVGTQIKGATWILDWRRGGQYQQKVAWLPISASNDYQRVLLTGEFEFSKQTKLAVTAGPDWRVYRERSASTEARDVAPYAEVTASHKVNAQHQLSLSAKRWRWVSSTGKAAYDDSNVALTWKAGWSKVWSSTLLVQAQESDYNPPTNRRDVYLTTAASVAYAVTPHFSLTAEVTHSTSKNQITSPSVFGREFSRNVWLLGVRWSK